MSTEFDLSRYEKGRLLGRGAFGEVHLYECLDGCEHSSIAVKKSLVKTESLTEDEKCQFEKEIDLLAKNNHPNIVRYLGHQKGKYLWMILEYMPGDSIKDRLRSGAFTEITTRRYTKDILKGLDYLHSEKNIIHNDIKGGNILLSSQDTAKLADFGISKELRSSTITSGGNTLDGTARFMSPEVVQCGKSAPRYGRKSDVWSVGCVVVQMFTTEPPWKGYSHQMQIMFAIGNRPPEYKLPETVSEEAKKFVQDCFITEPECRPAANELLCSGFLQVQPDKELHDRLLHTMPHMLTENEFKELKDAFCDSGEVALEAVDTIDDSFCLFGLLESDKLISVGQYDALIKHLETMKLEECTRVIREHTEKIENCRQKQDNLKHCLLKPTEAEQDPEQPTENGPLLNMARHGHGKTDAYVIHDIYERSMLDWVNRYLKDQLHNHPMKITFQLPAGSEVIPLWEQIKYVGFQVNAFLVIVTDQFIMKHWPEICERISLINLTKCVFVLHGMKKGELPQEMKRLPCPIIQWPETGTRFSSLDRERVQFWKEVRTALMKARKRDSSY